MYFYAPEPCIKILHCTAFCRYSYTVPVISVKKTKIFILITVFIAACAAVGGLFSLFSDSSDISGGVLYEKSVSFIPDDGGAETVIPSDRLYEQDIRFDGVYKTVYVIDGDFKALSMCMGAGEAEIDVDGETVFSGGVPNGKNISSPTGIEFSVFPLDGEKALTVKARYSDPNNYIFPIMIYVTDSAAEDLLIAKTVAPSAILAGISGMCFLLAIGLFLMSIYYSSPNFSLIILAVASISYCLCRLKETGTLSFDGYFSANLLSILSHTVAPEMLLFIILNLKKPVLRYIFICSAVVAGLIIAANVVTIIFDSVPAVFLKLRLLGSLIYSRSFSNAIQVASSYLILACAIAVTVYYINESVKVQIDKNALESQNRAILSAYKNIVAGVRNTAEVRHEWKHDLMTLSLLYEQGRFDEIGKYLDGKSSFINGGERLSFAESAVLDVILNAASARANQEGVKLSASVNAPAELGVKDEDLCQLIMNMFDNAFEACSAVAEEKRYIDFSASLKNGYLNIRCANSFVEPESEPKKDITRHGFGMITMQKICSRYNSRLVIRKENGEFVAMTALETQSNDR